MSIEETYTINLTRPKDVSVARLKSYISDAIENWSGQFDPFEDPLFYGVKVKIITRKKK